MHKAQRGALVPVIGVIVILNFTLLGYLEYSNK